MIVFVAGETVDRSHQVGKRFDVIRLQIMLSVQDGGKPHDFGLQGPGTPCNCLLESFDYVLEYAVVAIDAGDAQWNQQTCLDQLILAVLIGFGQTHGRNAHRQCPSL